MYSSNELIKLIKSLSIVDRLKIVENILKDIREESVGKRLHGEKCPENMETHSVLISLAGVISEKEADVLQKAVDESRIIDHDKW